MRRGGEAGWRRPPGTRWGPVTIITRAWAPGRRNHVWAPRFGYCPFQARDSLTKEGPHAPSARPLGLVDVRLERFSAMHRYRTHTCGALRDSDIGQEVRLSGWCHRIRDHGGRAVHRPARPLRPDPGGRRPGLARPSRTPKSCARNGWCGSTARCASVRPAPRTRTCRPARSRSIASEIEVLGPAGRTADAGVRRPGISRRTSGSTTASSTCAASGCTRNIMMRGADHRFACAGA